MPEKLERLSPKQLKGRKIIATQFKGELEAELKVITDYITQINSKLRTNPAIPVKPLDKYTTRQLEELKTIYGRVLMRVRGLETRYAQELMKIDRIIVSRQ